MVVTILDINSVTHDVKRFVVEKPESFKFVPGQATEVAINKPGWEDKKRPFTFTSLNSDPNLEFTIKGYPLDKYPNHTGVTEEIHKLKKGEELIIDEPWGTISYKGKGVFIAGGAGITPFIAIIKQLEKDNEITGNKLIFSNKTKKDIILEDKLKRVFPQNELILTLTQEEGGGYEKGRINKKFLNKHIDDFSQNFYVCGPKKMVGELKETLSGLGASIDSVVFEE
jgi:ferredoxin-NADP reductase